MENVFVVSKNMNDCIEFDKTNKLWRKYGSNEVYRYDELEKVSVIDKTTESDSKRGFRNAIANIAAPASYIGPSDNVWIMITIKLKSGVTVEIPVKDEIYQQGTLDYYKYREIGEEIKKKLIFVKKNRVD